MSRHRYYEDTALFDGEIRHPEPSSESSWTGIRRPLSAYDQVDGIHEHVDDLPRQQGAFTPSPHPRPIAAVGSTGYYAALRRNAELLDDHVRTPDDENADNPNAEFAPTSERDEFSAATQHAVDPHDFNGHGGERYDQHHVDDRHQSGDHQLGDQQYTSRAPHHADADRHIGRWRARRDGDAADHDAVDDVHAADAPTDAFDLDDLDWSRSRNKSGGVHRRRSKSVGSRGRIAISALAAGAFVAADLGQYLSGETPSAPFTSSTETENSAFTEQSRSTEPAEQSATESAPNRQETTAQVAAVEHASPQVSLVADTVDLTDEASAIRADEHAPTDVHPAIEHSELEPTAVHHMASGQPLEYAQSEFVAPTQGALFAGFGSQWGNFHYGIDIVNTLGTAIVAAADGVVVEAGPVDGLGSWVRQELPDGTSLVYGHLNETSAQVGQYVVAGEHLGGMGTRGSANVGHLYFEVWDTHGRKIDPRPWLAARSVAL